MKRTDFYHSIYIILVVMLVLSHGEPYAMQHAEEKLSLELLLHYDPVQAYILPQLNPSARDSLRCVSFYFLSQIPSQKDLRLRLDQAWDNNDSAEIVRLRRMGALLIYEEIYKEIKLRHSSMICTIIEKYYIKLSPDELDKLYKKAKKNKNDSVASCIKQKISSGYYGTSQCFAYPMCLCFTTQRPSSFFSLVNHSDCP